MTKKIDDTLDNLTDLQDGNKEDALGASLQEAIDALNEMKGMKLPPDFVRELIEQGSLVEEDPKKLVIEVPINKDTKELVDKVREVIGGHLSEKRVVVNKNCVLDAAEVSLSLEDSGVTNTMNDRYLEVIFPEGWSAQRCYDCVDYLDFDETRVNNYHGVSLFPSDEDHSDRRFHTLLKELLRESPNERQFDISGYWA